MVEQETAEVVQLTRQPRVGFVGTGWIGQHRMKSLRNTGCVDLRGICEANGECAAQAQQIAPRAECYDSLNSMIEDGMDAIVIATPNYMHLEQCEAALRAGCAVFCQKPLARTYEENHRLVSLARQVDRLLHVDLSYRHSDGVKRMRELVLKGDLGFVYALDLIFHNAYGPDKAWYRNASEAGGGCVLDLGIHLIDLAMWITNETAPSDILPRLYSTGNPITSSGTIEDYAEVRLDFPLGSIARIACSWNLPAGRDAIIEFHLHGSRGGASLRNVNGSFYDFRADYYTGRETVVLSEPPDDWGSGAICAWANRLAKDLSYDPNIETILPVAATIDEIYGR